MATMSLTYQYLKRDLKRRLMLEGKAVNVCQCISIIFKPSVASVVLYRLSFWAKSKKIPLLGRVFFLLNYLYSKNEISPEAIIGPGLVLGVGGGVGIPRYVVIGEDCTLHGSAVFTVAFDGVDLENDRVVLGDHCVMGARSRVMRPVELASGTQIQENSSVIRAINKTGIIVAGNPARRKGTVELNELMNWNPLYGGKLDRAK